MGRYLTVVGLIFVFCALSSAHVVVNSLDYRDVISAVSYANVVGETSYYVYPGSSLQDAVLAVGAQEITLATSSSSPAHTGYRNALENNGAEIAMELTSGDALSFNAELASLSGATSFVITDPDYTYNAVSLFGYAKSSGSYILFANKDNAAHAASLLSSLSPSSVLVYGSVDSAVISSLDSSGVAYEQIETGDKYSDNVALLEKYYESYDSQGQITFTDGTFLEPSITEGTFPVMFVSHTIPPGSEDYLASLVDEGKVSVGVLVKGDYTSSVYNLMKTINENYEEKMLSVFVKMGQSSSAGGQMQVLDSYPLPSVVLQIELSDVQYNTAKEEVELILKNTGTIATYATSTIRVYSGDELVATVGDEEPVLLGKGETKGTSYPLIVDSAGDLSANVTVYYSSSKLAFENALTAYVDIGAVDFLDSSSLEIATALYSPSTDSVSIKFSNPGSEDVYLEAEVSYTTDSTSATMGAPGIKTLAPGQSTVVPISGLLISEEELDSLEMEATARYGGREEFLINTVSAPVQISSEEEEAAEEEGGDLTIPLLVVVLIVVVVAAYFLLGKKGGATPVPAAPVPKPVPPPKRKRK